MRLDPKIQDNSSKEMKRVSSLINRQGKFTKNELFHNFCKDIVHIFGESFLISQCLESPPYKKLELFLTLVNGWNLLPIVTESLTLYVVEALDVPLVLEDYVCD